MTDGRTGALLLVLGAVGILGMSPPTAAAAPERMGGSGDDEWRAVHLLRDSAQAMRSTSYSGTRMISAWGEQGSATLIVDIEHVAGDRTRLTVRGDGRMMAAPGTNSGATELFPAGTGGTAQSDGLSASSIELLTESYAVTVAARDSVAGRPSTVVEISRGGVLAARLWVDDASGLLLRREVFDAAGHLVRASAFIDVEVDVSPLRARMAPPEPVTEGLGVRGQSLVEAAGWDCPMRPGALRLVDIERLDDADAMHMTYSDGLSRVSVFEQRGSLDPRSVRGYQTTRVGTQVVHVHEGMPTYAVWERDGIVFTAVTDGPMDSVAAVVLDGARNPRPDLEFWDRVASGMTRLGAWSTPLL
ncbi:MAG: sigma-E factor regulatory protein RseB domain-containing protein [Nocardioidaceae bacterium]